MRFLILFLLIPVISFSQKRDYKKYDKAVILFDKGENEKAKKLLIKILDKDLDWDQPHILMSSILAQEGDVEEAANCLIEIYDEKNFQDVLGIQRIAELYYKNGFYINALKYFNIAWELDSSSCNKQIPRLINNCHFAIHAIEHPVYFQSYNLGKNINSSFAEYLPSISVDNNILFITRRVEEEGKLDNEDIFFSVKSLEDNNWGPVESLQEPINSIWEDGAMTLSPNGRVLIFTICHKPDSYGGCDLYFSNKQQNDQWSLPLNLGSIINTRYKETQPCFSADGRYLYFVSNRLGGEGGLDIWRTSLIYNNDSFISFSSPENLGQAINTSFDEMSPFIHADNLTLYFASNGHIGMGNYDLFISRRDDSESAWKEPENMGFPINTFNIENSLIVSNDGSTAYFASNKSGFGKEDIFWFELPKNIQANSVNDLELEIITKSKGEEIILKNVLFDHNSYHLNEISKLELNQLIDYLLKNPNMKIVIEGHTDNVGAAEDNLLLSKNRAKTVYNYLLQQLGHQQLPSYQGYGESTPISNNDTEKGRSLNRRTSFRIIQ